ncbi:putative DSBA oxidoreductase [Candidatus Jettenia caeni]|uniref:Putative DSBA oxidoreductase n=1 Tax=Candidatus Jettenia caeni TaxID=247490 RepID=I3IQ17_9BACT|nr:thioredoxin domain-containing protein [Candidatus Jettenia sp. AMX1]MCQ3928004.1 hypothetical protein [Candidatus Jettenia sp.]WKZ15132.1 MAG: thioredoxin domain-containing protein [Candidatus Jettenia caeni]KAA0247232.1 MAG: hypothetical protein EDM77_15625 [Candidatus Jettenia sp. AMX1]MCE7881448.1 hypothetical protein [Candidatus Jettenia sp. AMX1]MDL1940515.1 hypothetical protein [Candidatus Jettenia sp. AMX1]
MMNKLSLLLFAKIMVFGTVLLAQTDAVLKKEKRVLAIGSSGKQEDGEDCNIEIPSNAVAIVNGTIISQQAVDEKIRDSVFEIQQVLLDARSNELYLKINSDLLDQEAKKRKIDTARILQDEVIAKVKEPTEAEALAFYHENKSQLSGEFNALKEQIMNYLQRQRQSAEAKKLAELLRSKAQIQTVVDYLTLADVTTEPDRVLAVVNGEKITLRDIDKKLQPEIFKVQEQIYELQKQTVDLMINDLLFQQEAQRRNITIPELLNAEVTSRQKRITKKDILAFYMKNKDRVDANHGMAVDRGKITQYLKQHEEERAKAAFTEQLRQAAALEIFLAAPKRSIEAISTRDQPSKGNENATITIVEFIDYECSTCSNLHEMLEELMKEYGNKVRLVARDFPLQRHANAYKAAIAAEAAREQGNYWEYIAILFQNQRALGADNLKEYASQLGLNRKMFDEALDTEKFADKVKQDRMEALRLGLNSTPTVFVNGRRVAEKTYESLKAAIETAWKEVAMK